MRTHTRELVVDAGLFNAHQLQPREMLRCLMQGSFGWLEENVTSYPKLVEKHGFGFVYINVELRYHRRISFTDFDLLKYDTQIVLKRQGSRLDVDVRILGSGKLIADISSLLAIVKIEETAATSARPSPLDVALRSRFQKDECSDAPLQRSMPERVTAIEASRDALATARTPFQLARHQCEFADQWLFFQIPTIYEPAREQLILAQGSNLPVLKSGLRDPLKSMSMELNRPFFAFDRGYVETNAYDVDGQLTCLHRLCSDIPNDAVHATVIEYF